MCLKWTFRLFAFCYSTGVPFQKTKMEHNRKFPQAEIIAWDKISKTIFVSLKESENEVAQSCPTLCNHMGCSLTRLLCLWNYSGKSIGVGCLFLLQAVFPTQGSNPDLPHCRQTLYHMSHQWSHISLKFSPKSIHSLKANLSESLIWAQKDEKMQYWCQDVLNI